MNLLTVGGLALSLLGTPLYSEPAPTEKIKIDLVTVIGSGCPSGTTAVAVAPDNTAFTVTYSNFLSQVGVGAKSTDNRKNCQLAVQVHVPTGFTYAVVKADYRGYANLVKGAYGVTRNNYYFQGMSETARMSHRYNGPLDDNWQATDEADIASVEWAPCGALRYLNINTELRVYGGTSDLTKTTSYMSMDSTDATISTLYHMAWRKCTSSDR